MALVLPKGIVVNSPGIADDIQKKASQRLATEEIYKLWHVYTTTSRRLVDPTARRLENLFWRVWGDKNRRLGSVFVSNHFAAISAGSTDPKLGPLKSSADRDESGQPSVRTSSDQSTLLTLGKKERTRTKLLMGPGHYASQHSAHAHDDVAERKVRHWHDSSASESRSESVPIPAVRVSTRGSMDSTAHDSDGKISIEHREQRDETSRVLSQASQVIALPPILKKSRGQSSAGPRPTARFVSPALTPAVSDNESDDAGPEATLGAPTPRKAEQPVKRKTTRASGSSHQIVVGKRLPGTACTRRPGLARQPSSQSSTGSDFIVKVRREARSSFQDDAGAAFRSSQEPRQTSPGGSRSTSRPPEKSSRTPDSKQTARTNGSKIRVRPGISLSGRAFTLSASRAHKKVDRTNVQRADAITTESEDISPSKLPGPIDDQSGESNSKEPGHCTSGSPKHPSSPHHRPNEGQDHEMQGRRLSQMGRTPSSAQNLSLAYSSPMHITSSNVASVTAVDAAATIGSVSDAPSLDSNMLTIGRGHKSLVSSSHGSSLLVGGASSSNTGSLDSRASPALMEENLLLRPSRSVSNLLRLLQKDDQVKAKSKDGRGK